MGRDVLGRKCNIPREVSTHAPAWGATISILSAMTSINCFNPRARMGRDIFMCCSLEIQIVSTHAPAWGATAY